MGTRILVVNDSENNREVARRMRHGQGATVALAVNGQEALDWLVAHPDGADLVLMDVQMPVLDGIQATLQLRRMPQFAELPIVALTAGAFKAQQDAAQEAGMTHFISKPFDVGLILLTGVNRDLLTLAQDIAVLNGLKVLGAFTKPLERETLGRALGLLVNS